MLMGAMSRMTQFKFRKESSPNVVFTPYSRCRGAQISGVTEAGKHLGEQLACPGGIGVAECVEVAREGEGGGVLRVGICGAGDVPLTRALRVYAHGGEDTGWRGLSGA